MNKMIALIALALLVVCGTSDLERREKSMTATPPPKAPIHIGIAWPFSEKSDHFRNGVLLAIQDINAEGGVLGRQLETDFQDDKGQAQQGKIVAQYFAERDDLDIVIGHYDSHVALPASVTYEYYGLLMITPGSSIPELTNQGFRRVFRTIPSDVQVGAQLAEMAHDQGLRRMVIIHERGGYGRQLANAIEFRSESLGIAILERLSYDPGVAGYRLLFDRLRMLEYDGFFFAGFGGDARVVIDEARRLGIDVPFLGGNGLDTRLLFAENPRAVEGTLVLSVFHIDNPSPYVQSFRLHFTRAYHEEPDAWAAQGYDAVQLLAHAIHFAQSAEPDRVAGALREMDTWQGVTGAHRFDENGEVRGKPMVPKIVREGKLAYYSP